MTLVGKTIARVEDFGDTLYFTDGTSLHVSSDDGHWVHERDRAETLAAIRVVQGRRESDRMRRLHDMLSLQDKEIVAEQEREVYRRHYEAASPLGKVMMDVTRQRLDYMRRDYNQPFYGAQINIPVLTEDGGD